MNVESLDATKGSFLKNSANFLGVWLQKWNMPPLWFYLVQMVLPPLQLPVLMVGQGHPQGALAMFEMTASSSGFRGARDRHCRCLKLMDFLATYREKSIFHHRWKAWWFLGSSSPQSAASMLRWTRRLVEAERGTGFLQPANSWCSLVCSLSLDSRLSRGPADFAARRPGTVSWCGRPSLAWCPSYAGCARSARRERAGLAWTDQAASIPNARRSLSFQSRSASRTARSSFAWAVEVSGTWCWQRWSNGFEPRALSSRRCLGYLWAGAARLLQILHAPSIGISLCPGLSVLYGNSPCSQSQPLLDWG